MLQKIQELLAGKSSKSYAKILSKHPNILQWIEEATAQYPTSSLNEKLYIILHSPPPVMQCGNTPAFNTFDKELVKELKWDRIWDCGKRRWVKIYE